MKSPKKEFSIIILLALWIFYTLLYSISRNIPPLHNITVYLSLFGETGLNALCAVLSWQLISKSNRESKIFFSLLFVAFIFNTIEGASYNIYLNIQNKIQFHYFMENLFEIPFLLFLTLQLTAWFRMFLLMKNKEAPYSKTIFYIQFAIGCLVMFCIIIFVPLWQVKYTPATGFYMLTNTLIELLAFVFVTFSLGSSTNKNMRLIAIGFLTIMASDFIIRFNEVANNLYPGSPFEVIWILGLMLTACGLYNFSFDSNREQPQLWVCGWNSVQLQTFFWGFGLCITSLVIFFTVNYFLIQNFLSKTMIQNIPFVLIIFSILSVLISNLMAYQLNKPLNKIKDLVNYYTCENPDNSLPSPSKHATTEFTKLEECLIAGLSAIRYKTITKAVLTKTLLNVSKRMRPPLSALDMLSEDIAELKEEKRNLVQDAIKEIKAVTNELTEQLNQSHPTSLRTTRIETQKQRIVLVDDNIPLTLTWEMAAEEKKIDLSVYHSGVALTDDLSHYDKETIFYIDINLGEHSGIKLSKELHEKGYKNLYLVTGSMNKNHSDVNWVLGILGIDAPF